MHPSDVLVIGPLGSWALRIPLGAPFIAATALAVGGGRLVALPVAYRRPVARAAAPDLQVSGAKPKVRTDRDKFAGKFWCR